MEGLTPARGVAGFHQGGPFGGPGLATNYIIFTNSIFIGLRQEGKSMTPWSGKYYSLPFLLATPPDLVLV